jgi:hypothetical protein
VFAVLRQWNGESLGPFHKKLRLSWQAHNEDGTATLLTGWNEVWPSMESCRAESFLTFQRGRQRFVQFLLRIGKQLRTPSIPKKQEGKYELCDGQMLGIRS